MITPPEIFEFLQRDVIGQDNALRLMAVAIYKHLISHAVGNVLMIGNSGTGKTTIMKAMEEFFSQSTEFERFSTTIRINANLVADLAAKGQQTNAVMDRLAQAAANKLKERATLERMRDYISHGIVAVDEVDKIRAVVGGEANIKGIVAQDSLLTLMENEDVHVNTPYYDDGEWKMKNIPINTRHILFVAGGAFEELYSQVYDRVTEKSGIAALTKLVPKADGTLDRRIVFRLGDYFTHEDLFNYGMTPQFLARFQSVIMLGDLTAPSLIKIFRDIPGAIWPTAKDFFDQSGISLEMTEEAMLMIADYAASKNRIGARALGEVFGLVMRQFDPRATGRVKKEDGREVLLLTKELVQPALKEK